jgi:hypothetical protein
MATDVKLTLKLKSDSILRAKEYVSQKGISLSKLVEDFFDNITFNSSEFSQTSYSPLVKELSGIITLSDENDYKNEYENYLRKKYE